MASLGVHEQNVEAENDQTNSTSSLLHAKSFNFQVSSANRKSLQTLQLSSMSDKQLVGKHGPIAQKVPRSGKGLLGKPPKKLVIKPSSRPVEVYRDPSPQMAPANPTHNSSPDASPVAEDEAYQLLASETIPDSYWKLLAEERRVALDDSLHENEMLYKEIDCLREENARLSEQAEKADILASFLQAAVESEDESEASPVTDNPETTPGNCGTTPGNCGTVGDNATVPAPEMTRGDLNSSPDRQDLSVEDEGTVSDSADAKEDGYTSSYEVISLTDETPPTISDGEEQTSECAPILSRTDSDNVTLCSSPGVCTSVGSPGTLASQELLSTTPISDPSRPSP